MRDFYNPDTILSPFCVKARTVRDWNILPEAIVTATSLETFKDLISQ